MTVGPGITHEISVSDSYYSTWSTDSYSGASAKITVFPMQMLWKASDRPQSPSPDSNSYKEDSSTPKVSRAVVIGVSVAAGIALITAFVLLLLFMRYLKRRETVNSSNTANPAEKAELNGIPATRTNNIGIQEEGHRRSNDIPEAIYEIGGNSRAFPTVSNQPQEIANSSQSEAYDERRRFSSQDPNLAELAASPSLNKVLPTKRKE
jgi:hypothetical protein